MVARARACAAELALAGWRVRLWDLPEFAGNLTALAANPDLRVIGRTKGVARLDAVPEEIGEARSFAPTIAESATLPYAARGLAHLGLAGMTGEEIIESCETTG